jgi:hypothetical protein
MADCISESGFELILDLDSAFGPSYSINLAGQNEALFFEVSEGCEQGLIELGLVDYSPATRADYELRYRQLLIAQDCLHQRGVDLPEPPSLAAYVDSGGDWLPWDALDPRVLTPQELSDHHRACPQ